MAGIRLRSYGDSNDAADSSIRTLSSAGKTGVTVAGVLGYILLFGVVIGGLILLLRFGGLIKDVAEDIAAPPPE